MSKQPSPAPTASTGGPCPTVIKVVGRPGTGSVPSTIAPPDHPHGEKISLLMREMLPQAYQPYLVLKFHQTVSELGQVKISDEF